MDSESFEYADRAIRILDAQERIVDAKTALLPHMKQERLDKFMKALHQEAYPDRQKSQRITEQQLMEMLGNVGR